MAGADVGQALGVQIGTAIRAISTAPGVGALEIDPEGTWAAYRERIVGPVRGVRPEDPVGADRPRPLSGRTPVTV